MKFTLASTHDSFMLKPGDFSKDEIVALDRVPKFEELSQKGVTYADIRKGFAPVLSFSGQQ